MYKYYNANPNNETTGDCVIRALSLALDIDYFDIVDLLIKHSNFFNCDMLIKDCYGSLLDNFFSLPKYYGDRKKVGEIVEDFPDSILLLRTEGHLTCSMYGTVYDIWDTSNEIVDIFWIVKTL